MLEAAIRKYQNRAIETTQVIIELIELAKEMNAAHKRGKRPVWFRRRLLSMMLWRLTNHPNRSWEMRFKKNCPRTHQDHQKQHEH